MIWVAVLVCLGLVIVAAFELLEIDRLERENRRIQAEARKMMAEADEMREMAKANHLYAHHLLRVARDHERMAKAYLKRARKEGGQ